MCPVQRSFCRRSAILEVGGFDESMPVGEDVDLCWRLVEAGFRLRYEPIALVAHEHRTQIWEWFVPPGLLRQLRGGAVTPAPGQVRRTGDLPLESADLDTAGHRVARRSAGFDRVRCRVRAPDCPITKCCG